MITDTELRDIISLIIGHVVTPAELRRIQETDPGLLEHIRSSARRAEPEALWSDLPPDTGVITTAYTFIGGDWSNIEARLVLAFAGQRDKLALISGGHDAYCDMACTIYHTPPGSITKAHVEKRQVGKNTVLGCGFGMGWKKFRERYCPKDTPKFAKSVIDAYRKEWAPEVPRLWKVLEGAALSAVKNPGRAFGSHGIEYRVEGDWLVGHCPDGSCLYYYRPTLHWQKPRWQDVDEAGNVIECEGDWSRTWRYQVPAGKTNEQRIGPSGCGSSRTAACSAKISSSTWPGKFSATL